LRRAAGFALKRRASLPCRADLDRPRPRISAEKTTPV